MMRTQALMKFSENIGHRLKACVFFKSKIPPLNTVAKFLPELRRSVHVTNDLKDDGLCPLSMGGTVEHYAPPRVFFGAGFLFYHNI